MKHVISIDVEDWYQGIEKPTETWGSFEHRAHIGISRILELLHKHECRTTFFILGKVAEEWPDIVRLIHREGHELGTHGYSHEKVYNLSPDRFRRELRYSMSLVQDITGEPVIGHRAPYFSITNSSLWALDILTEQGIKYDSSIHPVLNWRYGIPNADRTATIIETGNGYRLLEIPVSTYPLPKINLPVGGGAYLRIYPYWFQRLLLRRLERRGEHIGLYLHPWELDPEHPRIKLPLKVSATHYFNLKSTYSKLDALLTDFEFAAYRDVFSADLKMI